MAWADELWKGRVIDAVHRDARNTLMDSVCPDKDQFYHSPCGYASAAQPLSSQPHTAHPHSISLPRHRYASAAQPDTFVNEEWFGLFAIEQAHGMRLKQGASHTPSPTPRPSLYSRATRASTRPAAPTASALATRGSACECCGRMAAALRWVGRYNQGRSARMTR